MLAVVDAIRDAEVPFMLVGERKTTATFRT